MDVEKYATEKASKTLAALSELYRPEALRAKIAELEAAISDKQAELKRLQKSNKETDKAIEPAYVAVAKLQAHQDRRISSDMPDKRGELGTAMAKRDELINRWRQERRVLTRLPGEIRDLEQELERCNVEMQQAEQETNNIRQKIRQLIGGL